MLSQRIITQLRLKHFNHQVAYNNIAHVLVEFQSSKDCVYVQATIVTIMNTNSKVLGRYVK